MPYASSFDNLRAGNYRFLCCVEQIAHWESGPQLSLRVRVGDDAGREFKWDQSPPPYCYEGEKAEKSMLHWKRGIFGAYAAGGWTHDPNPATGWAGWPRNASGNLVPPYVDFFVVELGGQVVPIMLMVTISVQAGYEKYPKILAVKQHLVDGSLVQAPMPRKVTPWIAERHRWEGTREDITIKPSDKYPQGSVVPSVKIRYDQLPLGVGGLKTLKDCRP